MYGRGEEIDPQDLFNMFFGGGMGGMNGEFISERAALKVVAGSDHLFNATMRSEQALAAARPSALAVQACSVPSIDPVCNNLGEGLAQGNRPQRTPICYSNFYRSCSWPSSHC
jgi:hypothetical protein